jgi:hypothetical protein
MDGKRRGRSPVNESQREMVKDRGGEDNSQVRPFTLARETKEMHMQTMPSLPLSTIRVHETFKRR